MSWSTVTLDIRWTIHKIRLYFLTTLHLRAGITFVCGGPTAHKIIRNIRDSLHIGRLGRGGSGAGSLGVAQQLTGGGVVAEMFRDLQKPARFSGGG